MGWFLDLLYRLFHDHEWGEWRHSVPEPVPGGYEYCRWVKHCVCGAKRRKWEHDYDASRTVSQEITTAYGSFPHIITGHPCRYCGAIGPL